MLCQYSKVNTNHAKCDSKSLTVLFGTRSYFWQLENICQIFDIAFAQSNAGRTRSFSCPNQLLTIVRAQNLVKIKLQSGEHPARLLLPRLSQTDLQSL